MPPPRVVEKAIGEKRVINHAAVGISVCPEIDVDALLAGVGALPAASVLLRWAAVICMVYGRRAAGGRGCAACWVAAGPRLCRLLWALARWATSLLSALAMACSALPRPPTTPAAARPPQRTRRSGRPSWRSTRTR